MTTWMRPDGSSRHRFLKALDTPARMRSAGVRVKGALVLVQSAARIIDAGPEMPTIARRLSAIEDELDALTNFLTKIA